MYVLKTYMSENAGNGQYGFCSKCKKPANKDGHDGCLGTLPGDIANACCGHGNDNLAYIQYRSGKIIVCGKAKAEQARLIRQTI